MKKIASSFCVAFSLYSVIPMPKTEWSKHTMQYALCFMPLIGVIVGVLELLWLLLAQRLELETILYGSVSVLIPLLVTGGIHLDGFMDTSDALCSYGDREKRLAILKDPHVGAFGVLYTVALLMLQLGLYCQMFRAPACSEVIVAGYAIARVIGGGAIVSLTCAKDSGLAHLFAEASDRKTVQIVLLLEGLLCLTWIFFHQSWCGIAAIFVLLVLLPLYRRFCIRIFGGVTGDLAGFAITNAETVILLVAVVGGLIVR